MKNGGTVAGNSFKGSDVILGDYALGSDELTDLHGQALLIANSWCLFQVGLMVDNK